MKDIMTAEEYHDNLEIYFTQISNHTITEVENDLISFIHSACEAYAKYYAKALIESLTDEDMVGVAYSVPYLLDVKDHEPSYRKGIHIGQKWAREELLKRNG